MGNHWRGLGLFSLTNYSGIWGNMILLTCLKCDRINPHEVLGPE